MYRKHALFALALLAVSACVPQTPSTAPPPGPVLSADDHVRTAQTAGSYYAGTTVLTYGGGHYTQVEYHAADGRSYLWYPGNAGIVTGAWRTEADALSVALCYRYPTSTWNPVTSQHGGSWDCGRARSALARVIERVQGDPLGLSSGRVPFVLDKGQRTTFRSLMMRSGRDPRRLVPLPTPR